MEITITADLMLKGKKVGVCHKIIKMPFLPYPGVTLVLSAPHGRCSIYFNMKVQNLFWRETNTINKIEAFGEIELESEDDLLYFYISPRRHTSY